MKTEQVRSIFVKTNHFSSHCAESTGHLYLSLLETRQKKSTFTFNASKSWESKLALTTILK